jgi:hypothetical protein
MLKPTVMTAMTGDSVPADVSIGDAVLGGAVNTYGRILLRANQVGADTQLARMARMVADAQSGKASIQRLADRVSAVFVPVVLVIAALTLAGWLVTGHPATAAFTAAAVASSGPVSRQQPNAMGPTGGSWPMERGASSDTVASDTAGMFWSVIVGLPVAVR